MKREKMLDRETMKRILMKSIMKCSGSGFTEETISRGVEIGLQEIGINIMTFRVQPVEGNFGLWSEGGYDCAKECGSFILPTSPDGEPLAELGRLEEWNGRHTFSEIYPGCYILYTTCGRSPGFNTTVCKVTRIDPDAELAYCTYTDYWDLPEEEKLKVIAAVELAENECARVNNRCNHYFWRAR